MRKARLWILLFVLVAIIVLAIALAAGFYYLFARPVSIEKGTVVEVVLEGSLEEFPAQDPISLLFEPEKKNVWQLSQVFEAAAVDQRIESILLVIRPLQASWAQIEELRQLVALFQESGKEVHSFLDLDMAGESEIYLASSTDSITMNPTSGVLLNGLMAEITFMKRTLESLDIKPEFIQFKEYKSPETFNREQLSDEIREMLSTILEDLQGRFVDSVAADREIAPEQLQTFIETGIGSGDEAHSAGLIDQLGYLDGLQERLQSEQNGEKRYRSISEVNYLKSSPEIPSQKGTHKIAVVSGAGTITTGESKSMADIIGGTTIASQLRSLRKDESVEGVIFRVNSPGGSAVGSDMIWREIQQLEESGTPVVVSMSGVAGSGGYYISMAAGRLVSQPSTITGSIGVIFGKFDVSGFLKWIGMDIDRVKSSPNADLLSPYSSFTAQQKEQVTRMMEEIYQTFVSKAAQGRGQSFEEFEPKAHGRIYTGAQALEIGLVDNLGGMREAVEEMSKALQVGDPKELRLELFPRPKSFWETLTSDSPFRIHQSSALLQKLSEEFRKLETPHPWLLMPELSIR